MQAIRQAAVRCSALLLIATLMLTNSLWADGKFKVLYSFSDADPAGYWPAAAVILDPSGNLYGTTTYPYGGGVFELALNPVSTWLETVLHRFGGEGDGGGPYAELVFDKTGNLYGTTSYGGNGPGCYFGCGTIFKLSPEPGGGWSETLIYQFSGGVDGAVPLAGLVFDAAGNLYGTAARGGDLSCNNGFGCGTVFKLTPTPDGGWSETVLHSFTGGDDEGYPTTNLIFDEAGHLYGTTEGSDPNGGEQQGYGTVFKLSPQPDGSWTERILYRFRGGSDGGYPSGLIRDAKGSLYGTTAEGGISRYLGVVFKLAHTKRGWKEHVLYSFTGSPDGANPNGLTFDLHGNLYGTTYGGGNWVPCSGCGTVFKLAHSESGWTETVIHRFNGYGNGDGYSPAAGLTPDGTGNFYGITLGGGPGYHGVVFAICFNDYRAPCADH